MMSRPDSRDWVFLSLGLVGGAGRTGQWEVSSQELPGLSLQLQFLQRRMSSRSPEESDTPEKCHPSVCQKEVLHSVLLVFSVDNAK